MIKNLICNDSLVLEREPSGRQHAVAKEASIAGSNRSALVSRQPDARRYFFINRGLKYLIFLFITFDDIFKLKCNLMQKISRNKIKAGSGARTMRFG